MPNTFTPLQVAVISRRALSEFTSVTVALTMSSTSVWAGTTTGFVKRAESSFTRALLPAIALTY